MMIEKIRSRRKPLLMTKPCRVCGEVKPLSEFIREPRCKDGTRHTCKKCKLAYKRRHQAKLGRMGRCTDCLDWAIPGKRDCAKHLEQARLIRHKQIKKRKKEGRCTSCGIKLHEQMDKGHIACLNCNERVRI